MWQGIYFGDRGVKAPCYTVAMIILLTGKPGVGKSTVVEKFISRSSLPIEWVMTKAILEPKTGRRLGFVAENSAGKRQTISHKTDIHSSVAVGENRVAVKAVDEVFSDFLEKVQNSEGSLTIIDEIGPIQLLSPRFNDLLGRIFTTDRGTILATIHYTDERLREYRDNAEYLLLEVSAINRGMLPGALVAITEGSADVGRMTQKQQMTIRRLLARYIQQAEEIQTRKLMRNAIPYVVNGRVGRAGDGHWRVSGNHGVHHVTRDGEALACDCDLFRGVNHYADRAGECSHIQSALIFEESK